MIDTTTPAGGTLPPRPRGIAADLRRLADTPGHQLTDPFRDGLRTLAAEVAKLDQPATGGQPPGGNPLATELRQIERDLLDPDQLLDVALERLRRLAEHVEQLAATQPEPATAELDAVAGGLEPEQECRAQALRIAADVAPLSQVIGAATADELAGILLDVAEPLAAWIRTGARPAPAGCTESREDVERVHGGDCLLCDRPAVEHPPETP